MTLDREDPVAVWGVGVHPGVPEAIDKFTVAEFEELIGTSALVAEIGLDSASSVLATKQRLVLGDILEVLSESPRIASIHSVGSTRMVLDMVERHRTQGVVLHWWRGPARETDRAIELGCYFSVNPAELPAPRVLHRVPLERILTETDHPFGNRRSSAKRPGATEDVEAALRRVHPGIEVRERMWANLRDLARLTNTNHLFPPRIRGIMGAAPTTSPT